MMAGAIGCEACGPRASWSGYVDESVRGSRYALLAVVVCACRAPEARSACWDAIVPRLVGLGVTALSIEHLDGTDVRDRTDIRRVLRALGTPDAMRYQHLDALAEPILWVADAAVWALGRGGEWAARVAGLVVPGSGR